MQTTRTFEPFAFLARLFFVFLRDVGNEAPWWGRDGAQEADGLYRHGPFVFLRLPGHVIIGVGVWLDSDIETMEAERRANEDRMADAIGYDTLTKIGTVLTPEQYAAARRRVAAQGLDYEEELLVLQTLGLFAPPDLV